LINFRTNKINPIKRKRNDKFYPIFPINTIPKIFALITNIIDKLNKHGNYLAYKLGI